MLEMTTSKSQYEEETIFHDFVDVFQYKFINGVNALRNFVSSYSIVVDGSQNTKFSDIFMKIIHVESNLASV